MKEVSDFAEKLRKEKEEKEKVAFEFMKAYARDPDKAELNIGEDMLWGGLLDRDEAELGISKTGKPYVSIKFYEKLTDEIAEKYANLAKKILEKLK